MHIHIKRYGSTPIGTFGELKVYNDVDVAFECFTVERPWLDNEPFKSCIPADNYVLEAHDYGKYSGTFAIVGGTVSHQQEEGYKRFACLFHSANRMGDVVGCIGLGERLGAVYGDWAVLSSKGAMTEFIKVLKSIDEQHTLTIEWVDND